MKVNKKILNILLATNIFVGVFTSCKPPLEEPDASFEILMNGEPIENNTVYIDEEVTFQLAVENDYASLFTGEKDRIYQVDKGVGIAITSDKYIHTFSKTGTYELVLVARNYNNWGEDSKEDVVKRTIEAKDRRKGFSKFRFSNFGISGVSSEHLKYFEDYYYYNTVTNEKKTTDFNLEGRISGDTIFLDVPSVFNISDLTVDFETIGDGTKVFVNGTEQVSGTTTNDFSSQVTYTLQTASGIEYTYTVVPAPFIASSDVSLTLGIMVLQDEEITQVGDTFLVNYAWGAPQIPDLLLITFDAPKESRFFSYRQKEGLTHYEGGEGTFRWSGDTAEVAVIAEDATVKEYKIIAVESDPVTDFKLVNLNPVVSAEVTDSTVICEILSNTDRTTLIPSVDPSEKKLSIKIDDVPITSGITSYDFSLKDTFELKVLNEANDSVSYKLIFNEL